MNKADHPLWLELLDNQTLRPEVLGQIHAWIDDKRAKLDMKLGYNNLHVDVETDHLRPLKRVTHGSPVLNAPGRRWKECP